jgi:hypothetical protein
MSRPAQSVIARLNRRTDSAYRLLGTSLLISSCVLPNVSPKPQAGTDADILSGPMAEAQSGAKFNTGGAGVQVGEQPNAPGQFIGRQTAGSGAAGGIESIRQTTSTAGTDGLSRATPAVPPGSPAAGAVCHQQNAIVCDFGSSFRRIRCDAGTWEPYDDCPDGEAVRCEDISASAAASCEYNTKTCDAAHINTKICVNSNVHVCGGDGSSSLSQVCGGDTPDCVNAECACLTRCNGQCSSLQWDSRNCGSCGHDCQAGACDSGVCGPATIARNAPPGIEMAVDEKFLYWITSDSILMRASVEGGDLRQLATLTQPRFGMISDGTHIYVPGADDALTQFDVETGDATVIATGQVDLRGLAIDDENLYWVRGKVVVNGDPIPATPYEHNLVKLPKSGGTPSVIVTATNLNEVVAHQNYLYYTSAHEVYRVAKNGGAPTLLVDPGGSVRIAGDRLYFEDQGSSIFSIPIEGGTPTRLFDVARGRLLMDEQNAYVVGIGPGATVDRYPLTVGAKSTPICPAPTYSYDLTVNGRFLFFGIDDRIFRMPSSQLTPP